MSRMELEQVKAIIARKIARGEIKVERSHAATPSGPKKSGLSMTKGAIYARERRAKWVSRGLTTWGKPRKKAIQTI